MEPPVSDELQQCYNLGDPFSVTGEAFFTPEFVCESVPLLNLQRFDVYRPATPKTIPVRSHKTFSKAVEAASRTKPRIRETNVYDMMVYNFQPQAGKKKPRKSAAPLRFLKLSRVSLIPTTMACLRFPNQEPRVRMPRHLQQERKILPEHADARPVPWDFSRSLRPILTWESQDVLVNMSAAITSKAPLCAHIESDVPSPSLRRLSDPTNAAATPTRRQSGVLEDLLAMLDVVVVELESSDGTELPKDISVVAAV
ncbi:hypothetical protein C8R44DRAFT_287063 [Mycena epipterygia]|nr:hypothetical protein C8R44DRAFT_287063 [Mycena epipterygia]